MRFGWSRLAPEQLDEQPLGVGPHRGTGAQHPGGEPLATFDPVERDLEMELPADGRDVPVVDVQVGGPPHGAPAAAVQPAHDLVEQQSHRATVRRPVAAEEEAAEHDATAYGRIGPLVD